MGDDKHIRYASVAQNMRLAAVGHASAIHLGLVHKGRVKVGPEGDDELLRTAKRIADFILKDE